MYFNLIFFQRRKRNLSCECHRDIRDDMAQKMIRRGTSENSEIGQDVLHEKAGAALWSKHPPLCVDLSHIVSE